jgi:hypothetical protein
MHGSQAFMLFRFIPFPSLDVQMKQAMGRLNKYLQNLYYGITEFKVCGGYPQLF